jgi:hypothetical protein
VLPTYRLFGLVVPFGRACSSTTGIGWCGRGSRPGRGRGRLADRRVPAASVLMARTEDQAARVPRNQASAQCAQSPGSSRGEAVRRP